jgi:hypothetical protein
MGMVDFVAFRFIARPDARFTDEQREAFIADALRMLGLPQLERDAG